MTSHISHPDLKALRDHLSVPFPTVAIVRIDDEIARAYEASSWFGLAADELVATVEIAVRRDLDVVHRADPDSSRLDPETHVHHRARPESGWAGPWRRAQQEPGIPGQGAT